MSKKKGLFRQCYLERVVGDITYSLVSYLPAKFAKPGNIVKLCDDYGYWTNGWVILTAGPPGPEPELPAHIIKIHKQGTGDSLPKNPPEVIRIG